MTEVPQAKGCALKADRASAVLHLPGACARASALSLRSRKKAALPGREMRLA